jgi:sugar phosphate isomerase/epimerase
MSIQWAKRVRTIAELASARDAGFDGALLPVAAVMEWDDDESFAHERKNLSAQGLSLTVFEAPLPKGVRVTEPGFNIYSWTEYLKTALRRCSQVGCKMITWGDGRARVLPFEGEIGTHKENFNQFVFMLCDIAERFGITVCIEPLGAKRTNYLNTPKEMVDFFSLIGKSNLAMAIGPRDLVEMGLGPEALSTFKDSIAHIILEHPLTADTSVPPLPSDGYDYAPFFASLGKLNYEGTASLPHDADTESLDYCRKLLSQAGTS